MTKVLIVLILARVVEAVGVVFLSKGLKQIGEVQTISAREIGRIIGKGATNPSVLLGVALKAAFLAPCLPALLTRREPDLAVDLAGLRHHCTGSQVHSERASVRVALGRGGADCDWRDAGELQRKGESKSR